MTSGVGFIVFRRGASSPISVREVFLRHLLRLLVSPGYGVNVVVQGVHYTMNRVQGLRPRSLCRVHQAYRVTYQLVQVYQFRDPIFVPRGGRVVHFPYLVYFRQYRQYVYSSVNSNYLCRVYFSNQVNVRGVYGHGLVGPAITTLSALYRVTLNGSIFLRVHFLVCQCVGHVSVFRQSRPHVLDRGFHGLHVVPYNVF